jgi:SAM-dependent methyltransferase
LSDAELERIRAAYRERDAAERTPYRWDNPGYIIYMQSIERALLRAFSDAGVQLSGARVLDVGSGNGYFLHRLREYGAGECYGLDLMENRITDGKARYPSLELRVGSATELPFEDGSFDLVTQFTCLSSILDWEVRRSVANEMLRAAKGGWVLSLDMRGMRVPSIRKPPPPGPRATPTVPIDETELRRLFGEPALLRRGALSFDIAQLIGRHSLLGATLAVVPRFQSHLIGLWKSPPNERATEQADPTA